MKYTLTNKPQKINETKGEIENLSEHTIVLAAGTATPTEDTARITVSPWGSYSFKVASGEFLYAWILNAGNETSIEVSVVNFSLESEGGDIVELTEQIQNLFVELGTPEHPIVGCISVKDGALDKVQQDGQLSQGYGTCFGSDKGMSGVIDRENGNIHIGDTYNNIDAKKKGFMHETLDYKVEKIGEFTYKFTKLATKGRSYFFETKGYEVGKNYTINYKVIENEEFFEMVYSHADRFGNAKSNREKEGSISSLCTSAGSTVGFGIYIPSSAPVGSNFTIEVFMSDTSSVVPSVINSAPSGRLVIGELDEFDVSTHTFIGIGIKANTLYSNKILMDFSGGYRVTRERYYKDSASLQGSRVNYYINEDVRIVIVDGVKKGISVASLGNKNRLSLRGGVGGEGIDSFEIFIIIKGKLTEDECDSVIELLESGRYIIPQKFIGTPHNIPYMPKKADDDGITYETLELDTARDTWLLEDYGFYEFIPASGGTPQYGYVKKVNDIWTIPDFFVNVSGVLRLKTEGTIRKVI